MLEQDQFQAFYKQHYRGVYYFFLGRRFPDSQAQELAQETFLRFFKSGPSLTDKEAPDHYLKVVAANLWRNTLRENAAAKRDAPVVQLDEAAVSEPAAAETPLDALISREQKQVLREAVLALPPRMRHCVVMHVYQGLKYRDIALVLHLSIQTVRSQLGQARVKLRKHLTEYFDLGGDDADDE